MTRTADAPGSRLAFQHLEDGVVHGEHVTVERSRVRQARGSTVELYQSGAAVALGQNVTVRQGGGALLAGGRLNVEQGGGQWLVGGIVQAKQVFAVAVIAAKVEGQVRCLFDARGAFAFGAGVTLMTALLRLLIRRR